MLRIYVVASVRLSRWRVELRRRPIAGQVSSELSVRFSGHSSKSSMTLAGVDSELTDRRRRTYVRRNQRVGGRAGVSWPWPWPAASAHPPPPRPADVTNVIRSARYLWSVDRRKRCGHHGFFKSALSITELRCSSWAAALCNGRWAQGVACVRILERRLRKKSKLFKIRSLMPTTIAKFH